MHVTLNEAKLLYYNYHNNILIGVQSCGQESCKIFYFELIVDKMKKSRKREECMEIIFFFFSVNSILGSKFSSKYLISIVIIHGTSKKVISFYSIFLRNCSNIKQKLKIILNNIVVKRIHLCLCIFFG